MATPNPGVDPIVKCLQRLFGLVSSLSPIRTDDELPDLDVSLWRFSPHCYEIALRPRGDSAIEEAYCRVRVWAPADNGGMYPLDYEQWVSVAQSPVRRAIPFEDMPDELLHSSSPRPGSSEIRGVPWIALISRKKAVVRGIGIFRGRVVCSDVRVALSSQLRFFWTYCARAIPAVLAWLMVSAVVILGLVLLMISPSFRRWIVGHLQELWEVWSELNQSGKSPVTTPTPL